MSIHVYMFMVALSLMRRMRLCYLSNINIPIYCARWKIRLQAAAHANPNNYIQIKVLHKCRWQTTKYVFLFVTIKHAFNSSIIAATMTYWIMLHAMLIEQVVYYVCTSVSELIFIDNLKFLTFIPSYYSMSLIN